MFGAALSFFLPWKIVPGAVAGAAFWVGGIGMWVLARDWLPPAESLFAGALYALNPYHLLVFYRRNDFSELLASSLVPFVVWFALKIPLQCRYAWPSLAVFIAVIWLLNAPAAVIMFYVLLLLFLVLSVERRNIHIIVRGGTALAIGGMLAAVYIIPAAYEQRWVNIFAALRPGLMFSDNFLFTPARVVAGIPYAFEHVRFNHIISKMAIGELSATALAIIAVAGMRRTAPRIWWALLSLATASGFLMLSPSNVLWENLPKLRFVQFPWRLLFVLGVPLAFFVAAALARASRPAKAGIVCASCLAILFATYQFTRINWRERGNVTDFYAGSFLNHPGYGGVPEYSPAGSIQEDLDRLNSDDPPLVARDVVGRPVPNVEFNLQQWDPERRRFQISSPTQINVRAKLLNYPAWRVTVNGVATEVQSNPRTGELLIPVAAGTSSVQIIFARTHDRVWGILVSGVALLVLMTYVVVSKRILFLALWYRGDSHCSTPV
jgi:hypothetical protein